MLSLCTVLLSATLAAGEPAKPELPAQANPVLPKDHLAYAIKLDAKGDNLFLLPGSRVDVVLTETVDKGKVTSGVILANVLIVAVDVKDKKTSMVVSIAVKMADVKILAEAEKKGQLSLLLQAPKTDDKGK